MLKKIVNRIRNWFIKRLTLNRPKYSKKTGLFKESVNQSLTLKELKENPEDMFHPNEKEWLKTFNNLGLDVSQVKTYSNDGALFVLSESKEEVVSRFQMGVGITMDGYQGPQTNAAISLQQEYPKEINWWSGELFSIRSFGGNKPWRIDSDGYIETTEEIRIADIQPAAQMAINNYNRYVRNWGGDEYKRLLFATILTESGGKINATRYEPHVDDTSYGLMQILMGTAKELGFNGIEEDLLNPAENIQWGYYLIDSKKHNTRLDPLLVAATYNAGGIYPSGNNAWGIRTYGYHLNRFAANYNAIVKALK